MITEETKERLHALILAKLTDYPNGVTVVDFCEDHDMRVQTVSARFAELEAEGLVVVSGRAKSRATGVSGKLRSLNPAQVQ